MNRNRKGIVIITTMLLLSIVIMIAALLVVTGRSTLLLGASYSDREQAYYAAECGIAYAQHCISKYKDWAADETTLNTIYDPGFTDFTVSAAGSQKNCVRGVLNGNGSEFYITFYTGTWSDASSPKKDVDRSGNLGSTLKYYSYNNISNDSGNGYSRAIDGTGKGQAFRTVAKNTAHIVVEGRCNQVKRYVEAVLEKIDTKTGSACSIAAGDIDVDLLDGDSVFLVDSAGGSDSKIRSMGDIIVTSANNDKNCYQVANSGSSCTGAGTESSPTVKYTKVNNTTIDSKEEQTEYGISCENKPQGDYLNNAKLKWSDVTKKYVTGSGSTESYDTANVKTTINAGTYVYMNSSADADTYKLYYFPSSYTYNPDADKNDSSHPDNFVEKYKNNAVLFKEGDYVSSSRSGDLTIKTSVTAAELEAGNCYLFSATNPIGIKSDENSGDFALAIYDYGKNKKYAPSDSYRTSFKLSGTTEQDPCLVSKTGGNMYIEGELSGKGKIMSGGELSFQGKSMLEADSTTTTGVSIYAQGSVNIDPVQGSGGTLDPNADIKEAWDAITSKLEASGSYYKTSLKDYKELQEQLLATEINGKNGKASLSDVLKNDYGYDKATMQEMINTIMSKNCYIGEDTSTSTSGTVQAFTFSGKTATIGANSYTIKSTTSGSTTTLTIASTSDADCNYIEINATYSGGVLTMTSETEDEGQLKASVSQSVSGTNGTITVTSDSKTYTISYDPTSITCPWTLGGSSKTNNQDSETIMMHTTASDFTELSFNDTILKGLVYTWKDFKARDLGGGSLSIRGGIVAYGGDPSSQDPGANGYGKIDINNGKYVTFTYDPDYMKLIFDASSGVATKRVMQSSY